MDNQAIFEIRRKIFHIFLGITLVILVSLGYINAFILFLIVIIGGLLSILSMKYSLPGISWFLKTFEREEQKKKFPGKGALTFFIGALISIKLFEQNIALCSIIILTIGDSISHIIGSNFGSYKTKLSKNKNIEGSIFGAIIAGTCASIFVSPVEAFIAAIVAMFFELIEIRMNDELVDDNIIVPLIAGTTILMLRAYAPIL